MKYLILILSIGITLTVHSQNMDIKNYEEDLKLEIVFQNKNIKTDDDKILLYITNQSLTKSYKIILPGDGSEMAWREPYIYFTAKQETGDNEWIPLEKNVLERCGLFDAEWQNDTALIKPKQKIQIYEMAYQNVLAAFNIKQSGRIRLTAHYDYKQGEHPKKNANQIPVEYKSIVEMPISENIKQIPSFEILSASIVQKKSIMVYTLQEKEAIQLADSIARVKFKKIMAVSPKDISEGQYSFDFYDKKILRDNKSKPIFTVKYKFNQPLAGKVHFFSFEVIVNTSTKETSFMDVSGLRDK